MGALGMGMDTLDMDILGMDTLGMDTGTMAIGAMSAGDMIITAMGRALITAGTPRVPTMRVTPRVPTTRRVLITPRRRFISVFRGSRCAFTERGVDPCSRFPRPGVMSQFEIGLT